MTTFRTLIPCALFASGTAFQSVASYNISDASTACEILKNTYPNITYLPEDAGYADENQGKSK
ncbi:hypothetical protein AA0117_g9139 [Alternaria alternata]|jgi:hypothetical protein|uniref:Uncharacterized protein n=2 Tax=Alternaria alternata complex TaxID=187734 RepID=A0A4Q4N9T6_ALTAL|nr:hypothetical protein AA0115_g7280 [Alternaria tenuissima]RYN71941.1 hypothetical protein AA0117_g9139 [Alternaria alternata]